LGLPGRAVTVPCADFVVFATPAVTLPFAVGDVALDGLCRFRDSSGGGAFCGR
jgi:hypothetical protein